MGCLFHLITGIAQLVEWRSPKPQVAGSIPASRANFFNMDKITSYFKESYDELMHKVEWPTGVMLVQSTVATIIGMLILTLIILGMDGLNKALFDFIYKIK